MIYCIMRWDQYNTKKLIAPFYFEGNTNSEMFNLWIKEILPPELKPNQTIIMDNAAFHKNKITQELIESKQCQLLYLPPYSPDFNPIEQKQGHIKNQVKKIRDKFKNFTECLESVLIRVQIYVLVYTNYHFKLY